MFNGRRPGDGWGGGRPFAPSAVCLPCRRENSYSVLGPRVRHGQPAARCRSSGGKPCLVQAVAEYHVHTGGRYHGQAWVRVAVLSVVLALDPALVSYRAPTGHLVVAIGHLHAPIDAGSSNTLDEGFPSGRETKHSDRHPSSSIHSPRGSQVRAGSLDTQNAAVAGRHGPGRRSRGRKALPRTRLPGRRQQRQRLPAKFFSPHSFQDIRNQPVLRRDSRGTVPMLMRVTQVLVG